MKPLLSIEINKQLYLPGEDIIGKILLDAATPIRINNIHLNLKGEETLGTSNFWYLFNVPILDERRALYITKEEREKTLIKSGEYPFSFTLPSFTPPSFKSANFGCEYILEASAELVGFGKNIEAKNHISVVPNILLYPKNAELEFGISNEEILFRVFLEKEYFYTADAVKGNYYLEYSSDNNPADISFQLEAVGLSLDKNFPFSEKIWSQKKSVNIKPHGKQAVSDNFFFNVPSASPPSGIWNTFRIHWIIKAEVKLLSGDLYKTHAYFDMYKFYDKFWEERGEEKERRCQDF